MTGAVDAGAALLAVLEEAQRRGFLGPGPVAPHVGHARGFATAIARLGPAVWPSVPQALAGQRVLDLGSGGGIPGIPLAMDHPSAAVTLVDAGERRAAWLLGAIEALDLTARVQVVHGRAETLARDPALRSQFDVVVARSFAAPAPTAEIGGAFLRVDGILVVSDPPEPASTPDARWPSAPLKGLGMALAARTALPVGTFAVLVRKEPVGEAQPRRNGIPAKRRLW